MRLCSAIDRELEANRTDPFVALAASLLVRELQVEGREVWPRDSEKIPALHLLRRRQAIPLPAVARLAGENTIRPASGAAT
jgi:hypothetical protein